MVKMPFIKRVYGMRLIKQNCYTKKESLNLCVASACTHEEDEIFALYGTYGDPKLLIQNFKCVDKSFAVYFLPLPTTSEVVSRYRNRVCGQEIGIQYATGAAQYVLAAVHYARIEMLLKRRHREYSIHCGA
jgi:hypothetical protein